MARRYTDSEKWSDEWFGSLPNDYRMIWLYLLDRCSHAGIWKKDFRGMSFNCNTQVTEEKFKEIMNGRVIDRETYFFIPKFLRYQYPAGINSDKPAIVSVRKELSLNNLNQIVRESLGNDFLIIKDKDKDKDTDKGKDKSKLPVVNFEDVNLTTDTTKKNSIWFRCCIDELYFDQLKSAHTGKDIERAIKESYAHLAADPPRHAMATQSDVKKLVNTWLTNQKKDDNRNGKHHSGKAQGVGSGFSGTGYSDERM